MKLLSNSHIRVLTIAGFAVFSASQAWAVFPFAWDTNASSVVNAAHGSWTGNGAVQPNIHSAAGVTIGGNLGTNAQIAVDNFSSGSFTINGLDGNIYAPGGVKSGDARLLVNSISATHTIALTGGTADLRLHNSSSTDGGANLFNSMGLTGFQGVTSVSWTTRFSSPIAGRVSDLTSLISRPMGTGLALIAAGGTGQDKTSFTVGLTFDQIYYENATNNGFILGAPPTAKPRLNPGFNDTVNGFGTPGATSFTSDQFNNINEFLLVRGYDRTNNGWGALDPPEVYMTQMTWTITPDAGKVFAADTIFVTSMDGEQYSNYINIVPEPTSYLLVAGSLIGGCLLRRRRA